MPSDLIPTKDAARTLRRSVSTLCRWVELGRITPAVRGDGRTSAMWFNVSEVNDLRDALRAEEDARFGEPTEAAS